MAHRVFAMTTYALNSPTDPVDPAVSLTMGQDLFDELRRAIGPSSPADATDEFANAVVGRIHEVGLVLASCTADLPPDQAAALAAATELLDALVRDIRLAIYPPGESLLRDRS